MINKITLVLLAGLLAFAPNAKADEGMWLPMFIKRLNYVDMQKAGLKLTPEEIYSVNNSSLKDAILGLGSPGRNFCTGEIISKEGLFLTNHHCGYGTIQENSTIEHNYLKDGFWAMKRSEEIPAGFSVSILDHMEDVTKIVLANVTDEMSFEERQKAVRPILDSLKKVNSDKEKSLSAVVKSFYKGNEYYMFVYKVYSDVRLVGAPPSSVGKFGGDTDNWMWPRHTGDFCMFRIYADKDNNPAKYAEGNVPLKPKHHLPVNIKGSEKGDYAMIMGFPGSTERYLSSYGIEHKIDVEYPTRIKVRRKKLDMYEQGMNKDEAVRIKYASKHARVSNYWKNFIGMTQSLKALDVAGKKRADEDKFKAWANEDADRKKKYGNVISDYESAYKELYSTQVNRDYLVEGIFGMEILTQAGGMQALLPLLQQEEVDKKAVDAVIQKLKAGGAAFYKNYDTEIDQNVMAEVLAMYSADVPEDQQPQFFKDMVKKNKGDFNKLAAGVFAKSNFTSEEKMNAFLEKATAKSIAKDPAFTMFNGFYGEYMKTTAPKRKAAGIRINTAERLFIDGIRKMNPDKAYYPDANSTLRLTYGNIGGYVPKDATYFKYYTTAQGILEKYVPGDLEFDMPQKLIELIKNKDFGKYGKDGELRVCFLSSNDITGGNSGSPVINAEGHLIGTAFDGNWEAMSGDVAFETNLQRTISVDVRYTLFIIDKFAGAGHLVDEMTVIE
ncbi:MAG: serine protease [Crocinitomicaceae bacterium]|nr:serine protease [Crocinitomicaceae bacterium]